MKRKIVTSSKGSAVFSRILMILVIILAVLLITGSLYAIIRPPDSAPLFSIGPGERYEQGTALTPGDTGLFTSLGRLRIPIAGQTPATLILSVGFPYPPDDRPFTEEIASRMGDLRSIAIEYFASLPVESVVNLDEEAAKLEILNRYNALLRLGRIENLFFSDLIVLE